MMLNLKLLNGRSYKMMILWQNGKRILLLDNGKRVEIGTIKIKRGKDEVDRQKS